jgi:hypothetical protein
LDFLDSSSGNSNAFSLKKEVQVMGLHLLVPNNDLLKACRIGQVMELVHSLALCTFVLW